MFQTIRAFTIHETLETRFLSTKFLQNENFILFSFECFDLNRATRIETAIYVHCKALNIFSKKRVCFTVRFKEIMRFSKLYESRLKSVASMLEYALNNVEKKCSVTCGMHIIMSYLTTAKGLISEKFKTIFLFLCTCFGVSFYFSLFCFFISFWKTK